MITHERGRYRISTNKQQLDLAIIHHYLSNISYWANGRSYPAVQKSVANSLCFGLYHDAQQVGFARVVTDYATFGWLCDVFILDAHRGQGLAKWLVETIINHPDLVNIQRLLLATGDAHELYRRYGGFELLSNPEKWMIR